jgi:hypothetical protein
VKNEENCENILKIINKYKDDDVHLLVPDSVKKKVKQEGKFEPNHRKNDKFLQQPPVPFETCLRTKRI